MTTMSHPAMPSASMASGAAAVAADDDAAAVSVPSLSVSSSSYSSSSAGTATPGVSTTATSETGDADVDAEVDTAPTSPTASSLLSSSAMLRSSAAKDHSPRRPLANPKDRRTGAAGYRFATTCATVDDPHHKDQYGSSSAPIYMSATFKGLPGAEFDYSRSGNPTRSMLQHHLCQLQSCRYSFAVSSGMACLDVITRLLKPGERILAGDDLYGGTNRLLTYLRTHGDVETDHVDTTDAVAVEEALRQRSLDAAEGRCGAVKMVLLETPTNPLLKVCDLRRCAQAAKKWAPDALVVVDNTMMSPYLMRPLELGLDVVYDSGTKYLSGHHDLMAGVIACNREDVGKRIAFMINSVGNALTPMDSFLLLRGIKTLAIRMDQQQRSAVLVAHYLDRLGFRVHYPGLATHPNREVHESQAGGPGAVLSFETGDARTSERILGGARLWGISVSFGCVNSLISMPCLMSHASIDPKVRAARRLPEDLIRLCVGIEDCRDLVEDLEAALVQAGAIRRKTTLPSQATALQQQQPSGRAVASADAAAAAVGGAAAAFQARPSIESVQAAADQFERTNPAEADGTSDRDDVDANEGPGSDVAVLSERLDGAGLETRGGEPDDETVAHTAEGGGGDAGTDASGCTTLVTSAPGKVILFGEHAVVHGVKAVAASVALRCYAHARARADGAVSLAAPDLRAGAAAGGAEGWSFAIDSLPWDKVPRPPPPSSSSATGELVAPESLDPGMLSAIEARVAESTTAAAAGGEARAHGALVAFLYLFMLIAGPESPGQAFVVRSTLPIGAGLGSSAAFSTCVAASLLYTHGRLRAPTSSSSRGGGGGGARLDEHAVRTVDAFAFVAEKVLHGNPSGVDNAVATRGGAVAFVRPHARNGASTPTLRALGGLGGGGGDYGDDDDDEAAGGLRFLLTDTRVARDTKRLVAGVAERLRSEPAKVNATLDAIQAISDEAEALLDGGDVGTRGGGADEAPAAGRGKRRRSVGELEQRLSALMRSNQAHLVSLGVSHPALDAIVSTTARWRYRGETEEGLEEEVEEEFAAVAGSAEADAGPASTGGLATKLTGAGGGGCAVTLVPRDVGAARLASLRARLESQGFGVHETRVGGRGVGVLFEHARAAPVGGGGGGGGGGGAGGGPTEWKGEGERGPRGDAAEREARKFGDADADELRAWCEAAGEWSFA